MPIEREYAPQDLTVRFVLFDPASRSVFAELAERA